MKRLIFSILSVIAFSSLSGCSSREKNNVEETKEIDINTPMKAPYMGDTLIGKFNGLDIDTLISEHFGKKDSIDFCYWNWRVYTKNGTVKDLILENKTIDVRFVREGDLDGNGTEEWGYITCLPTSTWMKYNAFTNINGEWQYIIKPTTLWLPHLGSIPKEDILQPSNTKGYIKVKFSDVRNNAEDFLIIDTLIRVNPQPMKEKVQELTDYGEPFPIDVVKECIYYNGGKGPQKNIHVKDLFGEWEFERDIKVTLKLNPDMTYRDTREGYFMDEDNNTKSDKKVKRGKFTYKNNILTLLDYNIKEELHPTDWKKYKNPLNKELVVFSLKRDTLSLYESGVGNNTYLRFKKQ